MATKRQAEVAFHADQAMTVLRDVIAKCDGESQASETEVSTATPSLDGKFVATSDEHGEMKATVKPFLSPGRSCMDCPSCL